MNKKEFIIAEIRSRIEEIERLGLKPSFVEGFINGAMYAGAINADEYKTLLHELWDAIDLKYTKD